MKLRNLLESIPFKLDSRYEIKEHMNSLVGEHNYVIRYDNSVKVFGNVDYRDTLICHGYIPVKFVEAANFSVDNCGLYSLDGSPTSCVDF